MPDLPLVFLYAPSSGNSGKRLSAQRPALTEDHRKVPLSCMWSAHIRKTSLTETQISNKRL